MLEQVANIYREALGNINEDRVRRVANMIRDDEDYDNIWDEGRSVFEAIAEPDYSDSTDPEVLAHFDEMASTSDFPADQMKQLVREWDHGDDLIVCIEFIDEHGY